MFGLHLKLIIIKTHEPQNLLKNAMQTNGSEQLNYRASGAQPAKVIFKLGQLKVDLLGLG